jgi:biopolymer transport protein ExbB
VGLALAQEGAASAGEEVAHKKTVGELFEATGPVGKLLVLTSIVGATMAMKNFFQITREKLAPTALAEELEALIDEEKYDEAIEVCDQEGGYLANLIGAALRMRDAGYEEMIVGLEQAAVEETFRLTQQISYVSLVGNIGPLLGLLGTVTGMISSFQEIEQLKAPAPKDLAKGVYESLVNTTMGLFIAILFLTVYFILKNKVTKMTLSMNLQAVDLLRHMAIEEKKRVA